MARTADVRTTQVIVFIQAGTEVVKGFGVVSSMVDGSVAIGVTACAVGAIDAGEASGLAWEASLRGVVVVVAGDAST